MPRFILQEDDNDDEDELGTAALVGGMLALFFF